LRSVSAGELTRVDLEDSDWQRAVELIETYADLCEMLLILIRQHNLKEENILYPLCDRSLAQGSQELLSRLAQTLTPHEPRH